MTRLLIVYTLLLGAVVTVLASPPVGVELEVQAAEVLGLRHAELLNLAVAELPGPEYRISLTLDGQPFTLVLSPHTIRSAVFELFVQDENGTSSIAEPPPCHTVRGTVEGRPDSVVVGSWVDGRLRARLRLADDEPYWIDSLDRHLDSAPAGQHVVYHSSDVLPMGGLCGSDGDSETALPTLPDKRGVTRNPSHRQVDPFNNELGLATPRGSSTYATEISADSDVECFQNNGSSVEATVDHIEGMMVMVDDIYRSDVDISYVLQRIIVRTTEPDPFSTTDGDDLIDQLRSLWEDSYDDLERDVVHLFTGKDTCGDPWGCGLAGKGYIAEVCYRENQPFDDGGYSFSEAPFGSTAGQVALISHELGHNWDGTHCDDEPQCNIMCSSIGECSGVIDEFGPTEVEEITDFRDGIDCLNFSTDTVYVWADWTGPEDGSLIFPYNTFREGAWAVNNGGAIIFFGGDYDEDGVLTRLDRPMTLTTMEGFGSVIIGQ